MKRFFLLFCISLFWLTEMFGQIQIEMEISGGIYKIPCLVNGAKMKMVFDTGASSVCLSQSIAEYLLENEYLSECDFVGAGKSVVADGTIVDNLHLIIRDIEIAGLHLYDVEAVVIESQSAPLLLGLSAINKLGKVELDGNILTITQFSNDDEELVDTYVNRAIQCMDDKLYSKAAEFYAKAHAMNGLSNYGKYQYAKSLMFSEQCDRALVIVDTIDDYDWFVENDINIYDLLGWVYSNNNLSEEAIAYYQKAFDLNIPSNTYTERAYYAMCIGREYDAKEWYESASKSYQVALTSLEIAWGLRDGYLYADCIGKLGKNEKSYRNDDVDYYMYLLVKSYWNAGVWSDEDSVSTLIYLAKTGNKYARQFLNRADVSYNS